MKKLIFQLLIWLAITVTPLAAAPLPSSVSGDAAFMTWYDGLTSRIASDRKYKRIPLDTESKANAFVVKLHELYRQKISRDAFFVWVDINYPGYDYEQIVIVNYLNEHKPK